MSENRITVKANDRDGDLLKMWYIHFRFQGRTLKKYGSINSIDDVKKRKETLDNLKLEWQQKLDKTTLSTVVQAIKNYLDKARVDRNWRDSNYNICMSKLNCFADYMKGKPVTAPLVQQYFETFKSEKYGTTFNRRLSDFSWWFQEIGRPDLIPEISKSKDKYRPAKYYEESDILTLKSEIKKKSPEIWLAIEYMYNCALRPNELRLLRVENVLLGSEKIFVPADVAKTGNSRFARIPKNFAPKLQYLKSRDPKEYVFRSPINPKSPCGINHFANQIRPIMRKLGFGESYRPCYSWRNTSAVNGLIKDKIPPHLLQKQWGHQSLDQFMYYVRQLGVDDLDEFAENFSGI